ncbi:hypothetical protein E4T56_gene20055 [Termitomyces sp. T112]|nr:hypothetical protein E4T56_gene20055 [Termitomyces sp. T112]
MLGEHHWITHLILEHLCQHQLYLKPEAMEMDLVKVAGIAEQPEPKNKKEVQALLGFITFNTLKHAITSRPVLLFLNDNSPFCIEANSSDFTTGLVLLQQYPEDKKWHPVAFYSKSLNVVEQNYEIHDKEMLAIIWLFEEWQHFLEGVQHKFKVWMDHKNLEYFQRAKKLNCQHAQWLLYLANFDFSLHHKPGWSMGKPDALSQRVDYGMGEENNSNIVLPCPELFAIQAIKGLVVDGAEVDIL